MTLALTVALLFVIACVSHNALRLGLNYRYQLRPNCLLTRQALVFVSGRKSLLYFFRYWNFIPQFLRDHGYEVQELNLPWRNKPARRQQLKKWATQVDVHFIGDESSREDFEWLVQQNPALHSRLWIISHQENPPSTVNTYVVSAFNLNSKGILGFLTQSIWGLHQLVTKAKYASISVLALPYVTDLTRIGQQYLDFAISLAEKDY